MIRIGIGRTVVTEDGRTYQLQKSDDVLEIELSVDRSEFLSSIWMMADDGTEVLRLPLSLGPAMTRVLTGPSDED